ncbi:hypothetical protein MLD52_17315 [Puniceicoccaceae bacterium K14]|nr:hypothetical protein [Puniceicoccaceae bacterium K14]
MSEEAQSRQSSGRYIASQLPLGNGEGLPVSWQLCSLMAYLFLLFNQGLFCLMAYLKSIQDDAALAQNFAILSLVLGAIVGIAWVLTFLKTPIKKALDWVVLSVALLLMVCMFLGHAEIVVMVVFLSVLWGQTEIAMMAVLLSVFIGNLLATIWLGRGLIALWLAKKP